MQSGGGGSLRTQWRVVGTVEERQTPSERWQRNLFQNLFHRGARLINKKTNHKFGKSNGQRITTWMIKYPHIKKNAQHGNTPYYWASKPLSTSMAELIIITYYSIAVPVGIWAMMR